MDSETKDHNDFCIHHIMETHKEILLGLFKVFTEIAKVYNEEIKDLKRQDAFIKSTLIFHNSVTKNTAWNHLIQTDLNNINREITNAQFDLYLIREKIHKFHIKKSKDSLEIPNTFLCMLLAIIKILINLKKAIVTNSHTEQKYFYNLTIKAYKYFIKNKSFTPYLNIKDSMETQTTNNYEDPHSSDDEPPRERKKTKFT